MMRGRFDQRWRFEDRFGESLVVTGRDHATPAERATALDPQKARWTLEHSWRSWWRDEGRNDLVEIYRLLNYDEFNIRNVKTQELARRVFDAVERGHLLVFRGYGKRYANGQTDAVSVLVRQVMHDRREVSFEGQGYRIVDLSGGAWDPDGHDWRPVEPTEAVAIIGRMLDRVPRTAEERTQWAALLTLMKGDGTKPQIGLLRARRGGVAPQAEPETPRRPPPRPPQPEQDLSWIEVRVNDTAGNPYSGRVRVKLPNGASIDASTDNDGVLRLDGILPGSCTVALLDVSERLRAT
ncbi:MAG TPA: hypothetical protein VHG72_18360 [Polyangia bacterium]|nr:hypothetical protein [Polyangia bacterium]